MDIESALEAIEQLRAIDWLAIYGAAGAAVTAVMGLLRVLAAVTKPFVTFTDTPADDRWRECFVLWLDGAQLFVDRYVGRLSAVKPKVTGVDK